jgi:hypothetical protein
MPDCGENEVRRLGRPQFTMLSQEVPQSLSVSPADKVIGLLVASLSHGTSRQVFETTIDNAKFPECSLNSDWCKCRILAIESSHNHSVGSSVMPGFDKVAANRSTVPDKSALA